MPRRLIRASESPRAAQPPPMQCVPPRTSTPHGGSPAMHKNVRNALVALGVAVIVTPAAVSEGKERDGHRHGAPASAVEKKADRKARHEAKRGDKKVTYVFRGTY